LQGDEVREDKELMGLGARIRTRKRTESITQCG
jgi:hypothetical protein